MRHTTTRRRFVAFLLFLAIASAVAPARRRSPAPTTEIVVIGTVHAATARYTAKDLAAILEKVRPDVVLFEYPADMMTPSFEFKSIEKGSLEQEAVVEYVGRTGARIRPYDVSGRNAYYERTNYFARQRECNQQLSVEINAKRLGGEAQAIVDALAAANRRRDAIGRESPTVINSFESDAAINEKQWLVQQGIPEIVRLTPALKGCEAFWNLCGYEHRYWLRSALHEWDAQPEYVVKEYWE